MLETLGINEFSESVYRALLSAPGRTTAELSRELERSDRTVRRAVAELEKFGLVSRLTRRPVRFAATRPDTAIDLLIARRQTELSTLRQNARALTAELTSEHQPDELLQILTGQRAVADWYANLVHGCERELLVLDRPPYAAGADEAESGLTSRLHDRLEVRSIYAPEAFEHPGALAAARRAAGNGEQSRVHPAVPLKLAIADRKVALLPLVLEDMVASALVIRPCALLDALTALFELLWQQAGPLGPAQPQDDPRAGDSDLLTLLATGAKDGTIARQLGISSRTVSRRVTELLRALGARTRFQAGVLAERRGLHG
ncbi:helix-turn-helix transcriptional regulator [Amycolatopsis cihanbeyliensis]|uniref:helix-turn-helix transcriptional regulator n=1 Tax=Amycolatopsis cihanbeyliensis TaxID=1128664 RepID=UPI00114E759E|nr:helix-turn-helix transcriptional regulator [Amycolatopsis cihanbeyliensis]